MSHNGLVVALTALRSNRRDEILRLAERRGAHNLRVLGSMARGDAKDDAISTFWWSGEPNRSLLDHAGLVETFRNYWARAGHLLQRRGLAQGSVANVHHMLKPLYRRDAEF